jgi:hypothetical protein
MDDRTNFRVKTKDASGYTGLSEQYLRLLRTKKQSGGPAYYKIGKAVVYDTRDLDRWLQSHRIGS